MHEHEILKRVQDTEEMVFELFKLTLKGFERMANDFSGLNAAVEKVAELIAEAVTILTNPATDNNDQAVIDAITVRLNGAAAALAGAETPAAAPAPVEADPAPAEEAADEPAE
jgi:hypothetical protein